MADSLVHSAGLFIVELFFKWIDLVGDLLLFLANLCRRRQLVPPVRNALLLQSATTLAAKIRQGKVSGCKRDVKMKQKSLRKPLIVIVERG